MNNLINNRFDLPTIYKIDMLMRLLFLLLPRPIKGTSDRRRFWGVRHSEVRHFFGNNEGDVYH